MALQLTDQQEDILNSFSKWKNLKINAFAGTWKTTILKLLVERNPKKKFLVLVFNKSVSEELKKKFPSNADIYTINSLAYNKVKNRFRKFEVTDEKRISVFMTKQFKMPYIKAQILVDIFKKYCDSNIVAISWRTIKELVESDDVIMQYFLRYKKSLWYDYVAKVLSDMFEYMIRGKIPFTHSGYLKYFQIFVNEYIPLIRYDAILLDEWQDTNPVSLDIFRKLKWQKIIVWDTHQSIYWWRGAINAMEALDYDTYYITKSFRINKNTASYWNEILRNYKSEEKPLESFYEEWWGWNWLSCNIFRTNAWIVRHLFDKINSWIEFSFRWTRSLEDIFRTILDLESVYNYFSFDKDKKFLKNVQERICYIANMVDKRKDFCDLINKKIDDYELSANLSLLNSVDKLFWDQASELLVEKYNNWKMEKNFEWSNIIRFLFEQSLNAYDDKSNNILSTAHSVKWLEFDNVIIEDDFQSIYGLLCSTFVQNKKWAMWACKDSLFYYKIKNTIDEVEDLFYDNKRNYKDYKISSILEEVNLMYVAITRAIKELTINSDAINELLEVKRKDFNKYLHYKLVSLSSEHLKLSAWLLDSFVDDKTILVRNPKNIGGEWLVLWIEYSFCSTYVFNSIVKINNDKKRRRVLKNWKWLVVTFKSRNLNNKLNISYRNSWYTLKPKIKLSNIVEKFPEIKVDEWEFAEALCFDIKDSWIWEWELVIKTHKNNWIVFDVSDFSIIKKDVLEE